MYIIYIYIIYDVCVWSHLEGGVGVTALEGSDGEDGDGDGDTDLQDQQNQEHTLKSVNTHLEYPETTRDH